MRKPWVKKTKDKTTIWGSGAASQNSSDKEIVTDKSMNKKTVNKKSVNKKSVNKEPVNEEIVNKKSVSNNIGE
jgi:hypothetical protein